MSAIAVQDPATKDIVFAYRGTDIDKNIWEAMKNIESDLAIAPSGNVLCRMGWTNSTMPTPSTLRRSRKLVVVHVGTKSFTGHSLGGRLDGLGYFLNIDT